MFGKLRSKLRSITGAPYVPPHTHTYGPCRKDPFGGSSSRRCTYPNCRAYLWC